MGIKHRSLFDIINPIFIALTVMAIPHHRSAWKAGEIRVTPLYDPVDEAQCRCDSRYINYMVKHEWPNAIDHRQVALGCSSPVVRTKEIHIKHCLNCTMIYLSGTDTVTAHPQIEIPNFDGDFLDYVTKELLDKSNNFFNYLSSFVAATDSCMNFSTVLPRGWSPVTSSSQPVPGSDSNTHDISITICI
jgi:hypothetical protein